MIFEFDNEDFVSSIRNIVNFQHLSLLLPFLDNLPRKRNPVLNILACLTEIQ